MNDHFSFTITKDKSKERIDKFLAHSIKRTSRSIIKQLIEDGKVLVDRKPIKPSHLVTPGEVIDVEYPESPELKVLPENIPLDILYEDSHLVIVNKPAGMIVHPSPDNFSGTLVNGLLYHIKDLSGINGVLRPGIVHRIDKLTTGLLVVSKDDQTHRYLSYLFSARKMEKIYWALIWGKMYPREGVIEKSLKRSRKDIRKMAIDEEGKPSATAYKTLEVFDFLSLMEVRPLTGRTHQIRSHFASEGHPVFGDILYGGRERWLQKLTKGERELAVQLLRIVERQALHAKVLGFTHPAIGKYMRFEAPLPPDIQNALNLLRQKQEKCETKEFES